MILNSIRCLKNIGVLGMNQRNAEYIMKHNPRKSFPIVDDKLLTKRMAEKYGIPTPPLYHVIEYHGDLSNLKNLLKDYSNFVIKPARGAGGSGIILITNCNEDGFINQNGKLFSLIDLTYHISDILSGVYSLEGLEDHVLIEAYVRPNPIFDNVNYKGVPDVRIIVYRGVPVMGMVRLPTRASDGKANLHRGAIGVGIDMRRGTTINAVHRSIVIHHHPDTGYPLADINIPYWKEMLFMAAQSFEMTGLGYLGVDIVIDRDYGPLLLELNARPGLQIQIANQKGLLRQLEMIDKAPPEIFINPESRITWALDNLFLS